MSEWKQQRERIARGATNTLMNYMKHHSAAAYKAGIINSRLIQGRPNVSIKNLRKSPLIEVVPVNKSKNVLMRTSFWTGVNRCKESEWFDDEGIIVWIDFFGKDPSRALITRHAVQRAFERAWWFFKGKPVEDWVSCFSGSAEHILGNLDYSNERIFTLPCNILNAVVEPCIYGAVIRTYTPPTERYYDD